MKTKTQHTPLSWSHDGHGGVSIENPRGEQVAYMRWHHEMAPVLAAAPELLAALTRIDDAAVHSFPGCPRDPSDFKRMPAELRAAIEDARTLIAKTKGE